MTFTELIMDLQGDVGTSGLELFSSESGVINRLKIYFIHFH